MKFVGQRLGRRQNDTHLETKILKYEKVMSRSDSEHHSIFLVKGLYCKIPYRFIRFHLGTSRAGQRKSD